MHLPLTQLVLALCIKSRPAGVYKNKAECPRLPHHVFREPDQPCMFCPEDVLRTEIAKAEIRL